MVDSLKNIKEAREPSLSPLNAILNLKDGEITGGEQ
jgi:hypothetical protein